MFYIVYDLQELAVRAKEMNFYDTSVYFYHFFIKLLHKGDLVYKNKSKEEHLREAKENLKKLVFIHDSMLLKHGQFGMIHRCSSSPMSHVSKIKHRSSGHNESIPLILSNETLSFYKGNPSSENNRIYNIATGRQCDTLCKGGQLLVTFILFIND